MFPLPADPIQRQLLFQAFGPGHGAMEPFVSLLGWLEAQPNQDSQCLSVPITLHHTLITQ